VTQFLHDPDATLDYRFDWSTWLSDDETIVSSTVTVPTGLTLASQSQEDGIVTGWISGGTLFKSYDVRCRITTSDGRTDDRTMSLIVRDR
jgi:hypothetical protein